MYSGTTQDDAELENKDLDAVVLPQAMFPICFSFKDRLFGLFDNLYRLPEHGFKLFA